MLRCVIFRSFAEDLVQALPIGAGGLGIYATAVAREMGAKKVIVIDGIPERIALAKAFGADEVVNLEEYSTPEARVERVKELTDGQGGDIVLELVGFPNVVPEGLQMTAVGGRYVEVGNITPGLIYVADPSILMHNNLTILGVGLYEARHLTKTVEFLTHSLNRYPFDKIVSHAYPLEQIDQAFVDQDRGACDPIKPDPVNKFRVR